MKQIINGLYSHTISQPHFIRNSLPEPNKIKKVKPDLNNPNRLKMVLDYRMQDKLLHSDKIPTSPQDHKVIKRTNVIQTNFDEYAQDLQALYINIKWKVSDYPNGITPEEFAQIQLSTKLMNNGIIFIWSEKEYLSNIIDILETYDFHYVENFALVLISQEKVFNQQDQQVSHQIKTKKITDFFQKKDVKDQKDKKVIEKICFSKDEPIKDINLLPDLDPLTVLLDKEYEFFNKGKRILLMFRKSNGQNLELRHQRTGDIFFDIVTDNYSQAISEIGQEQVYQMIETLLPKARYEPNSSFKMMEIFADPNTKGRQGWIQFVEDKQN